jgi:hypothetical protein
MSRHSIHSKFSGMMANLLFLAVAAEPAHEALNAHPTRFVPEND